MTVAVLRFEPPRVVPGAEMYSDNGGFWGNLNASQTGNVSEWVFIRLLLQLTLNQRLSVKWLNGESHAPGELYVLNGSLTS